ncbi:hypothetical protein CapIbe_004063 [Capra ibex]
MSYEVLDEQYSSEKVNQTEKAVKVIKPETGSSCWIKLYPDIVHAFTKFTIDSVKKNHEKYGECGKSFFLPVSLQGMRGSSDYMESQYHDWPTTKTKTAAMSCLLSAVLDVVSLKCPSASDRSFILPGLTFSLQFILINGIGWKTHAPMVN